VRRRARHGKGKPPCSRCGSRAHRSREWGLSSQLDTGWSSGMQAEYGGYVYGGQYQGAVPGGYGMQPPPQYGFHSSGYHVPIPNTQVVTLLRLLATAERRSPCPGSKKGPCLVVPNISTSGLLIYSRVMGSIVSDTICLTGDTAGVAAIHWRWLA